MGFFSKLFGKKAVSKNSGTLKLNCPGCGRVYNVGGDAGIITMDNVLNVFFSEGSEITIISDGSAATPVRMDLVTQIECEGRSRIEAAKVIAKKNLKVIMDDLRQGKLRLWWCAICMNHDNPYRYPDILSTKEKMELLLVVMRDALAQHFQNEDIAYVHAASMIRRLGDEYIDLAINDIYKHGREHALNITAEIISNLKKEVVEKLDVNTKTSFDEVANRYKEYDGKVKVCLNCGSNLPNRALQCPYCDSERFIWQ